MVQAIALWMTESGSTDLTRDGSPPLLPALTATEGVYGKGGQPTQLQENIFLSKGTPLL